MKSNIEKIKQYIQNSIDQSNVENYAGNEFKDGYLCAAHHKAVEIMAFIEGLEWSSKDVKTDHGILCICDECRNDVKKPIDEQSLCECGHIHACHRDPKGGHNDCEVLGCECPKFKLDKSIK